MSNSRLPKRVADRVVALASDLVAIPSETPPGDEDRVAKRVAGELDLLGFDVVFLEVQPGRQNVIVTLPGDPGLPSLMLNSHLDVVPAGTGWSFDAYRGEIRDGWLLGRGSADAKGCLAAMIGAVMLLAQENGRGDIVLAAVVDEEGTQAGTRALVEAGFTSDHALIGEPTALNPIISQKGQLFCEVTVRGRAAHSSAPDMGVNAIYQAVKVVQRLEEHASTLAGTSHAMVGSPTLNVGTIQGGTTAAAVPDHCVLTLDRRTVPGEVSAAVIDELRSIVGSIANTELRVVGELPSSEVPREAPIVRAVCRALEAAALPATPKGWSATCDANILVEAGIPSVILGPGDLGCAHGPDERAPIQEILSAVGVYADVALQLAGEHVG